MQKVSLRAYDEHSAMRIRNNPGEWFVDDLWDNKYKPDCILVRNRSTDYTHWWKKEYVRYESQGPDNSTV